MTEKINLSIVEKIQSICSEIDGYSFVYGAEKMKSLISDKTKLPCIYLEEYRHGTYNIGSYEKIIPFKEIVVDIYFINTIDSASFTLETLAYEREKVRNILENMGVLAFIKKLNEKSVKGEFKSITECEYFINKPFFDLNNEVSLKLQIKIRENF